MNERHLYAAIRFSYVFCLLALHSVMRPPLACFYVPPEAKQTSVSEQATTRCLGISIMDFRWATYLVFNWPLAWICPFWHFGGKTTVCPKRPKRAFRDDWPIPRKGRPLDSPIGLPYFLPAAGHVLAKIPFYKGFTKRGGPPGKKAVFGKNGVFHHFATWESCDV